MCKVSNPAGVYPAVTAAPQPSARYVLKNVVGYFQFSHNPQGVTMATVADLSLATWFTDVSEALARLQQWAYAEGASLHTVEIERVEETNTVETVRESLPSGTIYKMPEGARIAGYVLRNVDGYFTFNYDLARQWDQITKRSAFSDATLFSTMTDALTRLQRWAKNWQSFFETATIEIVVEHDITVKTFVSVPLV